MTKKLSPTTANEEDPYGSLTFHVSPHLQKLAKKSLAIRKQFYPSDQENEISERSFLDPLIEDQFVKTKGLIHKYPGRVLITLTMTCAAYCRFCTRRRMVSEIERGRISFEDVDNMAKYLNNHPEISEVIFSGGDPLTVPLTLIYAINTIKKLPQIKIIRIHTRVPVSQPSLVTPDLLKTLKAIKQPLYISVHFEHPDEITPPTIKVIAKFRKCGATILSQSVFLKGINDDFPTLKALFSRLPEIGVKPYYLFRCDPTQGVEHFIVPIEKEVEIMTQLKKELSGLACPTYVIDTPNGSGKIPVPLNFWQFDPHHFTDYLDQKQTVT